MAENETKILMAKKPKARCSEDALNNRVKSMVDMKNEFLDQLRSGKGADLFATTMPGNEKTGINCRTFSLIPIHDCCHNCNLCKSDCYDINNVCFRKTVQVQRAINSALREFDIERYYKDIERSATENFCSQLRGNVGGDYKYEDFVLIDKMSRNLPGTDILFFTKNWEDMNKYLDEINRDVFYSSMVHPIWSRCRGDEVTEAVNNKHGLPESHILYSDGFCTTDVDKAYICSGNCSECYWFKVLKSCWFAKSGDNIVFPYH